MPPATPVSPNTVHDSDAARTKRKGKKKKRSGKNKYALGKRIGAGGFAEVYLGIEGNTGRLIAIKKPFAGTGQDLKELEREVNILKTCKHPNIVAYLGTDNSTQVSIFMEYVSGGTLYSLLTQFGVFKEPVITAYLTQMLDAIQYLHTLGIAHRDIKPQNVLVSDAGLIKLSDFGCSVMWKVRSMQSACSLRHRRPSWVGEGAMGTVVYMSPEACRQELTGAESDIWSLGCTLLQMASGSLPWSEMEFDTPIAAFFHIATCTSPPAYVDTLSSHGKDFLDQCLRVDGAQRPNAHELSDHPWLVPVMHHTDSCKSVQSTALWHCSSCSSRFSERSRLSANRLSDASSSSGSVYSFADIPCSPLQPRQYSSDAGQAPANLSINNGIHVSPAPRRRRSSPFTGCPAPTQGHWVSTECMDLPADAPATSWTTHPLPRPKRHEAVQRRRIVPHKPNPGGGAARMADSGV